MPAKFVSQMETGGEESVDALSESGEKRSERLGAAEGAAIPGDLFSARLSKASEERSNSQARGRHHVWLGSLRMVPATQGVLEHTSLTSLCSSERPRANRDSHWSQVTFGMDPCRSTLEDRDSGGRGQIQQMSRDQGLRSC